MKQKQDTSSYSDSLGTFVRDNDPLLIRGEIYTVPEDFFDSERQRLIGQMRLAARRSRKITLRRVVMRWSAAAAVACLLVAVGVSATLMFTSHQVDKTITPPPTPANSTAVQYHSADIADNSSRSASSPEWTRSDETESADILLWLY